MFLRLLFVEIRKLLKHPILWLGYTQIHENLPAGIFQGASWTKWVLAIWLYRRQDVGG